MNNMGRSRTGADTPQDRDNTSDKIWWAGEDQCDCGIEAKRFYSSWEKVLEAIRGEVHMLHKCK